MFFVQIIEPSSQRNLLLAVSVCATVRCVGALCRRADGGMQLATRSCVVNPVRPRPLLRIAILHFPATYAVSFTKFFNRSTVIVERVLTLNSIRWGRVLGARWSLFQ